MKEKGRERNTEKIGGERSEERDRECFQRREMLNALWRIPTKSFSYTYRKRRIKISHLTTNTHTHTQTLTHLHNRKKKGEAKVP